MNQNLGFRFLVIVLVVGFLGVMCYRGVATDPGVELGIDLRGGSEIEGKFDFSDIAQGLRSDTLKEAVSIIQQRIDNFGLKDISIQPVGDDRFTVQIAAREKENVDAIKSLITVLGKLEFRITIKPDAPNFDYYWKRLSEALAKNVAWEQAREIKPEDRAPDDRNNGRYPLGLRWYELSDKAQDLVPGNRRAYPTSKRPPGGAPYVLCEHDNFNITGESLSTTNYRRDVEGLAGDYVVVFDIKKMHQKNMAGLTKKVGTDMAIILNNQVDSSPTLQAVLSSSGQITGGFSVDDAKALAAILKAGALQKKPEIIAERTVASDLAGTARDRGILSIMVGFIAVLILMVWLYKGPGLLANLALILNLVIVVGVLYWFGAVLTLPGLAGLVLTVGMAVDANILVFERIKEEQSKGRTLAQAVATGYDRALITIIDANLTTLITAYMLFQIGSGPVRGFGITLAIGIIASMFTALYVTRTIFTALLRKGIVTEARMRGEFHPPSIAWMSHIRKAVTVSAFAMVAGFIVYDIVPEKKKYDLDFTQGAKLVMAFDRDVDLDEVRSRLDAMGKKNPKFANINVRVSTGGIGAKVVAGKGRGFELRTQEIGKREDIEALVAELRVVFKEWLLPGPFDSTVTAAGTGKSTGTVFFKNEAVKKVWLVEALKASGKFPGLAVEAMPVDREGVKAAFKLHIGLPESRRAEMGLNMRSALRNFDEEPAIKALEIASKNDDLTRKQKEAAAADLKVLRTLPAAADRGASYFEEADPFPLADRIDPSTAREHRDAAVRAIALSILGIILYVAFRFRSWAFGFAAVLALIHDVLIVLGFVAVCNWLGIVDARLNLVTVAAYLTLIGYSINDSIVVFDRIRENQGSSRARLSETINRSLNQTLSRTIRTTSTTWIVVALLFAMNYNSGSSLEGFAFVLMLGVLIGTYSSIFIAAPTLLYLPWLWERCGGTAKSFLMKTLPWAVGAAVALLAIDAAYQRFSVEDPSRLIFNDIVLGLPAGALIMFLVNFVRFVNTDKKSSSGQAATT